MALVSDFGWWGIPLGHLSASIVGAPSVTSSTPDESRTLILYGGWSSTRDTSSFEAFAASLPGATAIEFGPYNHWFPEPGPWPTITAAILDLARRSERGSVVVIALSVIAIGGGFHLGRRWERLSGHSERGSFCSWPFRADCDPRSWVRRRPAAIRSEPHRI